MISVFVYIMKISKTKLWKNILKELQKTTYIFVFIDINFIQIRQQLTTGYFFWKIVILNEITWFFVF